MKTVFDKAVRDDLINRINSLNENSRAQWGKMSVYQMLKHCTLAEEMYLGKTHYKRTLPGLLFGKIALKSLLKDETPMSRNAPTSKHFIVTETGGSVSAQKHLWIDLMEAYADFSHPEIEHWFFGKMTKEQVGLFVYKHTDHHLRQFGS
ncbi:DUF1569 domain-containing protein [Mucilaginibacter celer]|uniref:DUF1569 domain-containing protein n=1 Tax=Mucilaginibacter celer TaxID=2305508 RepID=A0A494W2M8_9SPHI|nr:DUF1569 domain-containing protein [Mucilaginibacter celer]AYL98003.1 DUF1569 domain-containing protein [Mucilaginibacter celer]